METERPSSNKNVLVAIAAGVIILGLAVVFQKGSPASGPAGKPAIFSQVAYEQALAANKTDGKLLLVKLTAEWCGPCKLMNKEAFVDPGVIDTIRDAGTAIEVDIDQHGDVATQLGVQAIPTMVLYKNGTEQSRNTGYMSADELRDWIAKAKG
jgi:thiol:disulfide interchange protein